MQVLRDSICEMTTSPQLKVARFYLLSDILHNSGAPVKFASTFRTLLQNSLPEIIEWTSLWKKSLSGRLTVQQVDDRVSKLFSAWSNWAIFPTPFILGLEAIYFRTENDCQRYNDNILECNQDTETLHRSAKLLGIATVLYRDDEYGYDVSDISIYRSIEYVKDYMLNKSNNDQLTAAEAIAVAAWITKKDDIESIDNNDEDEDVDGIPMTNNDDVDDDIDGVPIQDDSMYDDDIDGIPIAD